MVATPLNERNLLINYETQYNTNLSKKKKKNSNNTMLRKQQLKALKLSIRSRKVKMDEQQNVG